MPRVKVVLVLTLIPLLAVTLLAATGHTALTTIRVASGLNRPVYVTAPAGDDRLFIVEQRGVIKILKDGVVLSRPFLDIDPLVTGPNSNGDERGLLGLAFHPQYGANGKFYLNYINLSGNTEIAEYVVSADPDSADTGSARSVMTIAQDFANHNGGNIAFGPNDGYLYIGMGDGGSGGDPNGRGQDLSQLLGKVLRIDVNVAVGYAIPLNNPYLPVAGARDEIWAAGVRNPYRWSFDRLTGDLYIGDVGQNCFEEINFQPASSTGGENYGWDITEAYQCFNELDFNDCVNAPCGPDSLVEPISHYSHAVGGCSVTGGFVYRGANIPSLQGTYFYADYCSGLIWSIRYDGAAVTDSMERSAELAPGGGLTITNISGFGEDGHGELYIIDHTSTTAGEVYKIVDADAVDSVGFAVTVSGIRLSHAVPNPFRGTTRFEAVLGRPGVLSVEILDPAGRRVRELFSGEAGPGTVRLTWDGADNGGRVLPSGVYFLRATLDGEATARRVHLIR
jgi:glucose/arabinose dehydrogenase